MREIEFRAWDNEAKRWVSSGEWLDTMPVRVSLLEEHPPTAVIGSGNYHLMQFTGLLDKNRKKIFEGDVIKYEESTKAFGKEISIYTVVFGEGIIYLESHEDPEYNGYLTEIAPLKIIGNIYENPELLKGETNATN